MSRQKKNFKNGLIKVILAIGIIIGFILIMFTSNIGPWLQTPNLKGPYLSWTEDPKTTMTISWETPIPTNGTVQWGENISYGNIKASTPSIGNLRSVTLTGLEPNKTYHYRIISNIKNYSQLLIDHQFKTAPNSTIPFTFLVYGDSRPDIFGNSAHGRICKEMLKTEPNPAFVLHTGDIVFQSNLEYQWDRFFWEAKDIMARAPFFTTLGNHEYNEYSGDNGKHYFNFFNYPNNEWYYSFNYSNVHIICLNLSVSNVHISSAQKAWLINDLNKANSSSNINWIIIFFHVPLYSSGEYGDDPYEIQDLQPIFTQYKVDLVFSGHDHQYERIFVDGVQYVVAGGGGSENEVYIGSEAGTQYSENIHLFCSVEVNNLTLTVKAYTSLGILFDQFTLNSNHP